MNRNQADRIIRKRQSGHYVNHADLKEACNVLELDIDLFYELMKAAIKAGSASRSVSNKRMISTPTGGQIGYHR